MERGTMRRMPWATYFWPGLPQLWIRGSWSALALSVGAAVLLNLALLGSFVWDELIAPDVRKALWGALGTAWGVSAGLSIAGSRRKRGRNRTDSHEDTFDETRRHYLKGNWFQAERALKGMLRTDARDLDARLMLATLFRHTGRLEEAARQLNLLVRLEGAQKWEMEIRRERELLADARRTNQTEGEDRADRDSTDPPAEMTPAA